jgi:hypothetical protein
MDQHAETLGDEERSYDSEDLLERSDVSGLFASQDDEASVRQQPEVTEFLNSTSGGNVCSIPFSYSVIIILNSNSHVTVILYII